MTDQHQDHRADHLPVHSPVQVLRLRLLRGVGAGLEPDQGQELEEMVPGGTDGTPDRIPEAVRDHVAIDVGEGAILGTTEDTAVLLQSTDHAVGRGLVEDRITEDLTLEADRDQEAGVTMDLGELYILKLTEIGETGHEQDPVVDLLSI